MLEDYKKKPRHSKQKKKTKKRKIAMTQLATFIVHCGKKYKEGNVAYIPHMWDNQVYPKCVPADTDLDHDFNCFKCSD